MRHRFLGLAWACILLAMGSTLAYAQGGSTSAPLTGTVVDSSGAGVPGASIVVKNEGTGATYQAVSGDKGTFAVPALQAGTYTVTVSLPGFKQVAIKGLKILAATPAEVRATLEVGGVEETVTVEGAGAPLVQTQSTAISTTVEVGQINNLPVPSRNALEFLIGTPGVSTPGGTRDSIVSVRLRSDYAEARKNLAVAHNEVGVALADQGKVADAITHYSEALRVAPELADAHANLARAHAGQGRAEEAIRELQEALRLQPAAADLHYDAAVLLARTGRTAEALRHLEMALRLEPAHPAARQALERLTRPRR